MPCKSRTWTKPNDHKLGPELKRQPSKFNVQIGQRRTEVMKICNAINKKNKVCKMCVA